jgi:hypothetical protein
MKKTLAPLIVFLGLLSLLAGCRSAPRINGLMVELAQLEQAADGTFTATLRYTNPNVVAYNVARSTHKLTLNGRPVGTIVAQDPVGVPPQFTLTHRGRLKLSGSTTLPAGAAEYRMDTQLTLRLFGDALERVDFHSAGTTQVVIP